jgi:phage terminase Nu1 subunit (DNA packaging protein)
MILSESELMETLKVSRTTLSRWRKNGMPFSQTVKGGKVFYDLEEVRIWLKKNQ